MYVDATDLLTGGRSKKKRTPWTRSPQSMNGKKSTASEHERENVRGNARDAYRSLSDLDARTSTTNPRTSTTSRCQSASRVASHKRTIGHTYDTVVLDDRKKFVRDAPLIAPPYRRTKKKDEHFLERTRVVVIRTSTQVAHQASFDAFAALEHRRDEVEQTSLARPTHRDVVDSTQQKSEDLSMLHLVSSVLRTVRELEHSSRRIRVRSQKESYDANVCLPHCDEQRRSTDSIWTIDVAMRGQESRNACDGVVPCGDE